MNTHSARKGFFQLLSLLFFSLFFLGCVPYKHPPQDFCSYSDLTKQKEEALSHPLYSVIPRHREQLYWYDFGHWLTWAFFGNDDDGIFGEEPAAKYKEGQPNDYKKAFFWWCRNPLHNFCFYVIGSAYLQNSSFSLLEVADGEMHCFEYETCAKKDFASQNSCLYIAFNGGKPFISLRICYLPLYRADFYAGWRARGNFGLKCLPFKQVKEDL